MSDSVLMQRNGPVAHLRLNRPQAFNALDRDLIEGLGEHLANLCVDQSVRAVVVSGEGRAFCAGGDLKWAQSFPQGEAAAFHVLAARFHLAIIEIRRMRKPVIAAVNGVAAGGGFSLALACDFRVLACSATLRQAYTTNGLCVDGGGTFFLPRLVGLARALEIVGFDRPINSKQALKWGLATEVVDDMKAVSHALTMADELSQRSTHSFGWAKQLLSDSFDSPFESHIERERNALEVCAAHPDGQEGLLAFIEKRKPIYVPEA